MYKTNRTLTALFILLLPSICAVAQAQSELKAFQEAAGASSILFRGKQANTYERPANGTPYWSSPEFVSGTVCFEGNVYDDLLVNIDAVTGQVLIRKSESPIAVALTPDSVTSIHTDNAVFAGFSSTDGSIPSGFYEVLGSGPEKVYKHVSKKLLTSTHTMNGDPIGYYDPDYNYDLNSYYGITKTYYFQDRDGRFSRFKGKRALLRNFPERRKEIRKALSASGLDMPGTDFDRYCKELLRIAAQ